MSQIVHRCAQGSGTLGNGPVSQSHTQDIKAEASGAAIAAQPGGWGSVTCTSWERTRWGERGGEREYQRLFCFGTLAHAVSIVLVTTHKHCDTICTIMNSGYNNSVWQATSSCACMHACNMDMLDESLEARAWPFGLRLDSSPLDTRLKQACL